MRKLFTLAAIALMACPMVAMGATYSDDFDGTNPDLFWGVQDEAAQTEWWTPAGLQSGDQAGFNVSYGGYASLADADGNPMTGPQFLGSILTNGSGVPVVYSDAVTVSGTLNAGGVDASGGLALVAMFGDSGAGNGTSNFYSMIVAPYWNDISLSAYRYSGYEYFRMDWWNGQPDGDINNMLNVPVDLVLQVQNITSGVNAGNISMVGIAYADLDDGQGYRRICALDSIIGVDQATQYQVNGSGQSIPPASYVPKMTSGSVGFGGGIDGSVPQSINATADNFKSWDSVPGDFDLDGDVDVSDLGILATNYGTTTGMSILYGDGDMNGAVDVSDLGLLATNYGADVWAVPSAAVPEPATIILLAFGALALLIRRRK